jgi:hypothetical protein
MGPKTDNFTYEMVGRVVDNLMNARTKIQSAHADIVRFNLTFGGDADRESDKFRKLMTALADYQNYLHNNRRA